MEKELSAVIEIEINGEIQTFIIFKGKPLQMKDYPIEIRLLSVRSRDATSEV